MDWKLFMSKDLICSLARPITNCRHLQILIPLRKQEHMVPKVICDLRQSGYARVHQKRSFIWSVYRLTLMQSAILNWPLLFHHLLTHLPMFVRLGWCLPYNIYDTLYNTQWLISGNGHVHVTVYTMLQHASKLLWLEIVIFIVHANLLLFTNFTLIY